MSFENKEQTINPETLSKLKENQAKRDLDSVTKIFLSLTKEQQTEFVRDFSNKDPIYAQIISEITPVIQLDITKLMQEYSGINEKENTQTESELTGNTKKEFIEKSKDFSEFQEAFEEKEINGNKITLLREDIFIGLSRYESNKEPLAKALGQKEFQKLEFEENERLKYLRTAMIYAPENLDRASGEIKEEFKKKKEEVLQKYLPQADKFANLMKNTSIGKEILSNTTAFILNQNLKNSINKNLGKPEGSESQLGTKIEEMTNELASKMSKIQTEIQKEVSDFKREQTYMQVHEVGAYTDMLANHFPEKLESQISEVFRDYAKNIGKELIQNNSQIITDKKLFQLPIGQKGDEVVLDFSDLGDIKGKNTDEILKQFEDNFDKIYKDSLTSKIWREISSKKGLVDLSGTLFGGAMAVKFSTETAGLGIPLSAIVFTASENTFRAIAYELFSIDGGWKAGIGIDDSDTNSDILRKKIFELGTNGFLFGLFRATGFAQEHILSLLKNPSFLEKLSAKIGTFTAKTGVEAGFFTYFIGASNNLQEAIKNGGNAQEIMESFTKIGNIQDLTRVFAYNIGFILAVKGGGKLVEGGQVLYHEKALRKELKNLENIGIFFVDGHFYRGNNKITDLRGGDFDNFIKINQSLSKLSSDSYTKPENGRGGKSYNANNPDPSKRFERLEQNSKDLQNSGVSGAVGDKVIGETIENSGLQNGKGVGEGLLKKSGFDEDDIQAFKKGELKGNNPGESRALGEMDRAMGVVLTEVNLLRNKLYNGVKNGLNINEILKDYPKDTQEKIFKLLNKGM